MKKPFFLCAFCQTPLFLTFWALLPSAASAHLLPGGTGGISGGFCHPLLGLDHILAMVAVGLWAAQMGRRALWAVPCSFVGVMALGGMLGMMGIPLPFVEQGILASVLVLGLLVAAAVKSSLSLSMMLVGLFALLHGHAHGTEMTATWSPIPYAIGFLLATALLHGGGIALALSSRLFGQIRLVRYAGAAIFMGGLFLCFICK